MVKGIGKVVLLLALVSMFFGCSTTHRVAYPPSDDLFITMGDDPGTESSKPYVPKGTFIHVSEEFYLPIPVLGLITFGNANPQYVFETRVLSKVREMGGDALTSARVQHVPRPNGFVRFLGVPLLLYPPSQTIITGQIVKR